MELAAIAGMSATASDSGRHATLDIFISLVIWRFCKEQTFSFVRAIERGAVWGAGIQSTVKVSLGLAAGRASCRCDIPVLAPAVRGRATSSRPERPRNIETRVEAAAHIPNGG